MSKFVLIIVVFFFLPLFAWSQEKDAQFAFYIRTTNIDWNPDIKKSEGKLIYNGDDECLKNVFENNEITLFVKAFKLAENPLLQKTWLVFSKTSSAKNDLLNNCSNNFDFAEDLIIDDDSSTFSYFPNDYGTSSPIQNLGAPLDNSSYDYLEVPNAWDITLGVDNVTMVISDSYPIANPDINGKLTLSGFVNPYMINIPGGPLLPYSQLTSSGNFHGTDVAEFAAGKIDNGFGLSGVCPECPLYMGWFNRFIRYDEWVWLVNSYPNEKFVFNISGWDIEGFVMTWHLAIQEITNKGGIIVAAAGNENLNDVPNTRFDFPASYPEVISVSNVGHLSDPWSNIQTLSNGVFYTRSVRDMVSGSIGYTNNDPVNGIPYSFAAGASVMNTAVDILAPGYELPFYSEWLQTGNVPTSGTNGSTSYASPMVMGTVGLMLSVNSCLEFEEVMSIIKITSTNINSIPANSQYLGYLGAGSMNTFRAVEMAKNMNTLNNTSTIVVENQDFQRWDFILKSSPYDIVVQNQIFRDYSTVDFEARNSIELLEGTLLQPTTSGFMSFEINSNLSCYPPTSFSESNKNLNNVKDIEESFEFKLFPNPASTSISVQSETEIEFISIHSIDGREVYSVKFKPTYSIDNINIGHISDGLYVVSAVMNNGKESTRKLLINRR